MKEVNKDVPEEDVRNSEANGQNTPVNPSNTTSNGDPHADPEPADSHLNGDHHSGLTEKVTSQDASGKPPEGAAPDADSTQSDAEAEKKSTPAHPGKSTPKENSEQITIASEDEIIPDDIQEKSGVGSGQDDVTSGQVQSPESDSSLEVTKDIPAKNRTTQKRATVKKELPAEDPTDQEKIQNAEDQGTTVSSEGIPDNEIKEVDYNTFSLDELINTLNILVVERPVHEVKADVEHIKTAFYKKLRSETAEKKAQFLKEGGQPEDFQPGPDLREEQLKSLLNQFKKRKSEHNKELELQKQTNLEEKYRIIEAIEGLINKEESINKTFQDFRDLQNQWRSVGPVPQAKLKHLWENYHYQVEKFYDYIKINKELRDLDLKKNMEAKIALSEKAEELLLEPNVVNAFKTLQKYHDQWREIGPVPRESKDDLWERFRSATSQINRRHQNHFEDLKASLKKNLEEKTKLCERVEEILQLGIQTHKEWEKKSKAVIEIQKVWKTIGFAPKKHNTLIYERFRKACDAFFENKRAFYAENKEIQQNNLQLKTELCIQAEAMQESQEWKKTTEDLIELQKKWKEIGPVPKKYSDAIWKRFRAACDTFFKRKSEYYTNIDQQYEENLTLKNELVKEIENHKFGDNMDENVKQLQEFQRKWSEIGYVPMKEKNAIIQKYRNALNKLIEQLDMDDKKVTLLKYKTKLEGMTTTGKSRSKLEAEREKFMNKIKKLESDIGVWENNIGFFAKSENADSMIKEFTKKIERAKQNIQVLDQKVRMIDDLI